MQTFRKDERLSKKKIIHRLFTEGNSFAIYPFRIWWLQLPQELKSEKPVQLLISVSKRSIRKAVSRNLIKRRIREAYRKNKSPLPVSLHNSAYAVAFVYVASKPLLYKEIQEKIKLILSRLQKEYEKTIG